MPTPLDTLNIATRDYIMGVDPSRDEKLRRDRIADLTAAGYDPAEAQAAVDVADALDPPPRRAASIIDGVFQSDPLFAKLHGKSAPGGRTITASITFGKPRAR